MREGIRVAANATPARPAELLPGPAVDDDGVSADLDAAMKASRLSHLTAVAGQTCSLVSLTGPAATAGARLGSGRLMVLCLQSGVACWPESVL